MWNIKKEISGYAIMAQLEKENGRGPYEYWREEQPFILAMPSVLNDLLDLPVNLSNIVQARAVFLKYCLENGFHHIGNSTDEVLFREMKNGGLRQQLKDLESHIESMKKILKFYEELAKNTNLYLEKAALTEEDAMLDKIIKLNKKAKKLFLKKKLTIRQILLLQPSIVFDASNSRHPFLEFFKYFPINTINQKDK